MIPCLIPVMCLIPASAVRNSFSLPTLSSLVDMSNNVIRARALAYAEVEECVHEYLTQIKHAEIPMSRRAFLRNCHDQNKFPTVKRWKFTALTEELAYNDSGEVNNLKELLQKYTKPVGRPTTLTSEEEELFADRIRSLEEFPTLTVTTSLLQTELLHFVLGSFGNKGASLLKRLGKEKWIRGFQKRHPDLASRTRKRALEQYKALKAQPEVTTFWFRLILHTYALLQIHRRIAAGTRGMSTFLLCLSA